MPVRILIADDHGVLRAALRSLLSLEPDVQVVGEAGDGLTTLREAADLQPDVVLLDISMPEGDGISVTRELKIRCPSVKILILTAHEDQTLLREAINSGASGYVVKRALDSELAAAIMAVTRGDLYVHPSMTRALLSGAGPVKTHGRADGAETLTERETQVLSLLAQGHTNPQVAEILSLSVRTVESHRANIVDKLQLKTRADLVRYAQEHGLLTTH